ncbi:MAG: glutathione S-transferase C-terminal domain-containing protein [Acetobacteraceae bacterium]
MEARLDGRLWIMGDDYSIADIALLGWVRHFVGFYGAGELVGYGALANLSSWLDRCLARPCRPARSDDPSPPG